MGTIKKYKIDEELYKGHKGEYIATKVLNRLYDGDLYIQRVPHDQDCQSKGIDAHIYVCDDYGRIPKNYTFDLEIKTDFSNYQSLFVEDHSDFFSGKREIGYLRGSQSDILCYYFANQHKLILINFSELSSHVENKLKSKNPYKLKSVYKPEKTETTYYYIVPLADIKDYILEYPVRENFDSVMYTPEIHDRDIINLKRMTADHKAKMKMIHEGINV